MNPTATTRGRSFQGQIESVAPYLRKKIPGDSCG